jgi:hypothetical protein
MLINFKPEFKDKILDGSKDQTIRKYRKGKRQIEVGDKLQLYTGLRTKSAEKFADAVCVNTAKIVIAEGGISFDDASLYVDDQICLAQKDGFLGVPDFKEFFRKQYGLPFVGRMIQWKLLHE